jgi:hypothetical protein
MRYQIIDLDGCVANDLWRRQFIRPLAPGEPPNAERFEEYHKAGILDRAENLHRLHADATIIICTARPVKWRGQTEDWLQSVGIRYAMMIMRNNDDHRTSLQLKHEQVRWLPLLYDVPLSSIVQAIDDRPDIIAMYREAYNLPAEVVCIGEECGL